MIFLGIAWTFLGYAYCLKEDYRLALDFTNKGLKIQIDLGLAYLQSWCHWCCSLAQHGLGNLEEAKMHAEQALGCSNPNSEKYFQGLSRIQLGRILAKADPMKSKLRKGKFDKGSACSKNWEGCLLPVGVIYG